MVEHAPAGGCRAQVRPAAQDSVVTIYFRVLAIALTALVSASAMAQTQDPSGERAPSKKQKADRAKARCTLNRGVDCETPEGLEEWLLLERSRAEAVRDGSRHPQPAQRKPGPTGR